MHKRDEKMQQVVATIGQRYAYRTGPPLILDNYTTYKHEWVKNWLRQHHRVNLQKPIRKGDVTYEKILRFHH